MRGCNLSRSGLLSALATQQDSNPILNTLVYECELNDGTMKEYAANIIASNIYEEGDADGFLSSLLHQIVDHKSLGEKIKLEDKYITTRTGMDG